MTRLKAVAPQQDRVQIYAENPYYIQYRGEPVFLFGCNQGWIASLQNLTHDYKAEFARLAEVGGNLVRITPFICPQVDDETRFDGRLNNLPWRREGKQYRLDLDRDGGNPLFWDRLAELIRYAYERDILISFEFWDLYGPARGPGGNLDYMTPPGDRWSAHPFFPGNSPDLTGDDRLPAQTHMRDIAFCCPVTRGGYDKALAFQRQYVRRMLDVLSPYPNVMYCMVNETSADKSWSDYWLEFTHRYFDEVWEGAPHLAGEMPREFSFTENFTIEEMIDDARYDFADASQYYTGSGLVEAQKVKRNLSHFREVCRETGQIKPLTCMKVYNRLAPEVLWMRLLGGSASARYHRVINSNYTLPEGTADPAGLQLSVVGHMAAFLRDVEFQPWTMQPDHDVVTEVVGVDETLAMCTPDRKVCAILVFNEAVADEGQTQDRQIALAMAGGDASAFWLDPATGEKIEAQSLSLAGRQGVRWQVPAALRYALRHAVLYCRTA